MIDLEFVLKATHGTLTNRGVDPVFEGISTDSRRIKEGELFFAIRGERYDGHDFVPAVLSNRARGAVVERGRVPAESFPHKTLIEVDGTIEALGNLARSWRESMPDIKLAAITGSNGKTTTKEMTHSIVSVKFPTLKNQGNFNNDIGLPLTILKLGRHHKRAVVEFGMNDFGEIRRLTAIARPETGAITNIGRAHLEKLGGIEGVMRAKAELVEEFGADNTFVVNADDPKVAEVGKRLSCTKITTGLVSKGVDVTASDISTVELSAIRVLLHLGAERVPVRIRGIGLHNVQNALTASAIALSLGCGPEEIQAGLERYEPAQMRLEIMDSPQRFTIINDAYNANPESMRRGLEELARLKPCGASTIAVLGDMLELGEVSEEEHASLGEFAASSGVDLLVAYGNYAASVVRGLDSRVDGVVAGNHDEAAEIVAEHAKPGDIVLIKGSRGMKMEHIIQKIFTR